MSLTQKYPGDKKNIATFERPVKNLTLNDYREHAHITLRTFAVQTGWTKAFVRNVFSGQHTALEREQAQQCAHVLGIPLLAIDEALAFMRQQRQVHVSALQLSPSQEKALRRIAQAPSHIRFALGIAELQSPTHATLQNLGLIRCTPEPEAGWVHSRVTLTAEGRIWLTQHPESDEAKE